MFTCIYKLSIVMGSKVEITHKGSLKLSTLLSTNVLKDCQPLWDFNYTIFAGKCKYGKKWSCRCLQRGFIHSHYSNRTILGGRKWVEPYGE